MTKAQYITDTSGNRVSVIVSLQDYEKMIAAMEELEDIAAYDKAKNSNSDYMAIDDAFELVEQKRKQYALSNSH
jgi:hypothetical protein